MTKPTTMTAEDLWRLHATCMHLTDGTHITQVYNFDHVIGEREEKLSFTFERDDNLIGTPPGDMRIRLRIVRVRHEKAVLSWDTIFTSTCVWRLSPNVVLDLDEPPRPKNELITAVSVGLELLKRAHEEIYKKTHHNLNQRVHTDWLRNCGYTPENFKQEVKEMQARVPDAPTVLHRLEHLLHQSHPALTTEVRQFLCRHILDPK